MECPNIENLQLSRRSVEAIEHIRRIADLGNVLNKAMAGGLVVGIFAGNGVPMSSYNISNTDWKLWSQSMASVPSITKRRILDVAYEQGISHSGDERRFWQAVADGCRY